MARIRTIKPEFPQSERIGKLSRDGRLLFILLFTLVDDAGRARAASRMLASLLYPYDDDASVKMDGWLGELERGGHIRRYQVDGSQYLEIAKWLEHQKIDRPSESKLPAYSDDLASPREESRILDADLVSRTLDLVPSISAADPPRTKPIEKKSRKGSAGPLPDSYPIPERVHAYGVSQGLTAIEIGREHERFRNHAKQNDRRCVDWEAAERNWLLIAAEKLGRSPPTVPGAVITDDGKVEVTDPEQLQAWDDYARSKGGKSFPRNSRGGWRLPGYWPPGYKPPQRANETAVPRMQTMQ